MLKKIVFGALFCLAHSVAANEPVRTDLVPGGGVADIRVLLVGKLETTLSSQISARIQKIHVSGGESFRKNQRLVDFDCRILMAELNKAKATLQAAEKTHEANLKLQKFQAISGLEVALTEADVLKAEADVRLNRAQVSLCSVDAPFSGKVVKVHETRYASVPSGTPLLDIIDDSQLEMQLHVPSVWLSKLKAGNTFKVHIDETDTDYTAEILRLGAKIDPVSQTLEISARITDKAPELLSGMSGSARFGQ
jgi:RND family efflux transporter MFP subunit